MDHAKVLNCDEADWQASLEQMGWSMCPRDSPFLKGLWRHDPMPGANRWKQSSKESRMRFAFVISCIILLLGFIVGSTLTASQFSNHRCDKANWWASLDRNTWSVCPETNIYLRGFWRSAFKKRDERVGRLQEGRCCDAVLPEYAGQPATCSEVDLSDKLNRYNVWALCPSGYFMNGLRLGYAAPALLYNIDEAKCCHPQNHPKSDGYCYEENVTISFKKKGWSECQGEGFYMTGFYKSSCDELYCIEKFRCCKMKSGNIVCLSD
ncbi:uncharacterized protein LOC111337987 [Stylophora pistillata]|uniref:uncharacterized protein LOC111337987 n=1 Tax=Stylophora pistillata TaxID=50429 RepID=UPI000C03CBB7|nr:uncharacterized protein LOC111337987 [Stylophora pistillata]